MAAIVALSRGSRRDPATLAVAFAAGIALDRATRRFRPEAAGERGAEAGLP